MAKVTQASALSHACFTPHTFKLFISTDKHSLFQYIISLTIYVI